MPAQEKINPSNKSKSRQDLTWQTAGQENKIFKKSVTQSAENFISRVEVNDDSLVKIKHSEAALFGIIHIREGNKDYIEARRALSLTENAKVSKAKQPEAKEWTKLQSPYLVKLAQAMLTNKHIVDANELEKITLPNQSEQAGRAYIKFIQDCARRNRLIAKHKHNETKYDQLERRVSYRVMGLVGLGVLMVIFVPITFASFNIFTLIISGLCLLPFIYSGMTLFKCRSAAESFKRKLDRKDKKLAVLSGQITESANKLGLWTEAKKSAKQGSKLVIKPEAPLTITGEERGKRRDSDSKSSVSLTPRAALLGNHKQLHSGSRGAKVEPVVTKSDNISTQAANGANPFEQL